MNGWRERGGGGWREGRMETDKILTFVVETSEEIIIALGESRGASQPALKFLPAQLHNTNSSWIKKKKMKGKH